MAKSKSKSEKSNQPRDPFVENHSRVIKAGAYDGSYSSKDFVVSGHSTGSPYSEMEALSHQVSRDVGEVPYYPVDDNYRIPRARTDIGMAPPEVPGPTADLGGPDLYGPNPSLLKNAPELDFKPSTFENNQRAADAGIYKHEAAKPTGGTARATGIAGSAGNIASSVPDKVSENVGAASDFIKQGRSFWKAALWSSISVAGAALASFAAYKVYKDLDL